jgi:hypothetical protein
MGIDGANIKKSSDLIEYFYTMLQFYNPDRKIHYTQNMNVDKKFASSLVKSRMSTGISKKRALLESAAIIRCVIENESRFNISFSITSMSVLGQVSLKWITDRAIRIINMEDEEVEKEEMVRLENNLYIKDEKDAIQSLDKRITHLKGVLGGLNEEEKGR